MLREATDTASSAESLAGRISRESGRSLLDSGALEDRRLSCSLLLGIVVLPCLPGDGSAVGVLELSRKVGLSASTTHR